MQHALELVFYDELTDEQIQTMADVNFVAPAAMVRDAVPHLQKTKGSIINISSTAGHGVYPGTSFYSGTKGGLNQLTRVLAAEHRLYPLAVRLIAEGRATVKEGRVRLDVGSGLAPALLNPSD